MGIVSFWFFFTPIARNSILNNFIISPHSPSFRNQAKFTIYKLTIFERGEVNKPMLKQCLCLCLKILANLFVYSNLGVDF